MQADVFVTDHGSIRLINSGNISPPGSARQVEATVFELLSCRICGRAGLLVNPFYGE
jgi:hypothetical protein